MSQPIEADFILVARSPDNCPCQNVHVLLLHGDEEPIAFMPLTPAAARALVRELNVMADRAEAQDLRNEGRLA